MSKLIIKLPGYPPVTHDLGSGSVQIGRSTDCDLQILHGLVSKCHAIIERQGNELHIRDLGSHNGTFVNSQRVRDAVLQDGDAIRFAVVDCVFEMGDDVVPSVPAPSPAVSKVAAPTNSISTKDLPLAAPEDLEAAESRPLAAMQAELPTSTLSTAQSMPSSPQSIVPMAAPVSGTPSTAGPAPKPAPAAPAGKRAPLPRPTAQTLAALKSPPAPPPAKPGPAPSPGFQPRQVPRGREAMPAWLFLTLGIGVAGCAAAGVWFWLNSTTDAAQTVPVHSGIVVPEGTVPPEMMLTEIPPATKNSPDSASAGPDAGKPDSDPVEPEKMPKKPTISAVDAPAIGAMLRDPSVNIRRSAARALHALGLDAAGATRDLENALKDDDTETRIWAALALTQIASNDQASVPVLIQGLKHQSPEVREASALTVSMIQFQGDESAPVIEMLIRLSVEDPDEAVRRAAASASKLLNAKVSLNREE